MNSTELGGAKRLFFGLLWIDIIATAIIGLNAFSTIGTLREIDAGRTVVDQSMLSGFEFWENLAKVTVLTLIGVGIGLVKWLNACYNYSKKVIGVSGLKNEGWTTRSWLIPIFNLFKPYQVISEIYKVGAPNYTTPEGWKQEGGSGALLTWWIFWGIAHLIMWTIFRVTMSSNFGESVTIQNAIFATQVQAWACVISLAVAGLWFWVANLLTQRLQERRSVSANPSPQQMKSQAPVPATEPVQPVPVHAATTTSPEVSKARMPTNTIPSQPGNIQSMTAIDEDAIYEIVGNEIDEGRVEKGLWTRLFAEMDGDENKTKAAYIKRRAERLINAEHARLQEQSQRENEWQQAALLAEIELQKAAAAAGVTVAQAKEMLQFGITKQGDKFAFNDYKYDRLNDAVNYAKTQLNKSRRS